MSLTKKKRELRSLAPAAQQPRLSIVPSEDISAGSAAQTQGTDLSPGSIPIRLGPDHNSLVVSTTSGKEIAISPDSDGMAMLLRILDVEHRKVAGGRFLTLAGNPRIVSMGSAHPPVARYSASGKRQVTLQDLGL
jgi:hypothetical protein